MNLRYINIYWRFPPKSVLLLRFDVWPLKRLYSILRDCAKSSLQSSILRSIPWHKVRSLQFRPLLQAVQAMSKEQPLKLPDARPLYNFLQLLAITARFLWHRPPLPHYFMVWTDVSSDISAVLWGFYGAISSIFGPGNHSSECGGKGNENGREGIFEGFEKRLGQNRRST